MALHVLVVSRWYPAFDTPGRGSFVADHVAALALAGVVPTVVSFDPLPLRGDESTRPQRAELARRLIDRAIGRAIDGDWAAARPGSWGAPHVPVARLPVLSDAARRDAEQVVDAHAAPLLTFGLGHARRAGIDLVHAHTGLPDGIAAARLADRLGVPLVVTEHASTIAMELTNPAARRLYAGLAARHTIAAVSPSLAAELAVLIGVDAASIVELPNCVPVERFAPGPPAERDPDELLYVSARRATKGIEPLLRAFALVRERRPAATLRIVGPPGLPDDEARWAALVTELGIGDAIRMDGALAREGVATAMRRAAVFVHPSPHETFGMVAAEALASGLPVAATPSGGVERIVGRDGRYGAVSTDHSPAALAEAVLTVLERGSGFDPIEMRTSIVERFAPDVIAHRTIELYERLLEARPATPAGPRATGRDQASSRGPAARPPATLVVGLGRTLAVDRIADVPAPVRRGLVVVTRGKAIAGPPAPAVGDWLQVDLDAEYASRLAAVNRPRARNLLFRAAAAVRSPTTWFRRRRLLGDPDGSQTRILAEELRGAVRNAQLRADPGARAVGPVLAVPIEADDVLAVDDLTGGLTARGNALRRVGRRLGRMVRRDPDVDLAPGGLRWLVDARDATEDT